MDDENAMVFNNKRYFYVLYVITHSLLSTRGQFDGNISGGKCGLFLCRFVHIHIKICCQLNGNLA
jgi:hypothetical protein